MRLPFEISPDDYDLLLELSSLFCRGARFLHPATTALLACIRQPLLFRDIWEVLLQHGVVGLDAPPPVKGSPGHLVQPGDLREGPATDLARQSRA